MPANWTLAKLLVGKRTSLYLQWFTELLHWTSTGLLAEAGHIIEAQL